MVFLADLRVVFFAVFLAGFFAVFLAVFFAVFLAVFFAGASEVSSASLVAADSSGVEVESAVVFAEAFRAVLRVVFFAAF